MNALRNHVDGNRKGFCTIAFTPPGYDESQFVELWMRRSDAYIVAFKGADQWYYLEENLAGKPAGKGEFSGVESNYNKLANVNSVNLDMLKGTLQLKDWKKGAKINETHIVVIIACVSEALRFATTHTYFQGMINGYILEIPLAQLKQTYFLNWDKLTGLGSSDVIMKK